MLRTLWRFAPIFLMVAAMWWGADRLVPAMQSPIQGLTASREGRIEGAVSREVADEDPTTIPELDTGAITDELLQPPRIFRIISLKDLVILAVIAIAIVWTVKWFRHRSLLSYLRRAAEHKQALERAIQHETTKVPLPPESAAPEPPTQLRPPEPSAPRERERPEPDAKTLAEANALLVSHLSSELALRGVKTSPDRTARLLARAQESLLERVRYLDDDSYKIAATLGTEVRRLLTGDPKYLTEPQWQMVADAMIEVVKVLDRGPDFQWACDTIEGFVMGIEDLEQVEQKSKSFAREHGPMGRLFGAVTSGFRRVTPPPPLPDDDD